MYNLCLTNVLIARNILYNFRTFSLCRTVSRHRNHIDNTIFRCKTIQGMKKRISEKNDYIFIFSCIIYLFRNIILIELLFDVKLHNTLILSDVLFIYFLSKCSITNLYDFRAWRFKALEKIHTTSCILFLGT